MSDLLQAVLEDPAARSKAAMTVVASQAAADFAPWSTLAGE